MAKTVDQFSTLEDFRQKYNELAIDVGDKSGLRTTATGTIVDSLNSLEDKSFFFQEFVFLSGILEECKDQVFTLEYIVEVVIVFINIHKFLVKVQGKAHALELVLPLQFFGRLLLRLLGLVQHL